MKRVFLGSLLVAVSPSVMGQTYSWSDPAGGLWSDFTNWTGNQRPNATTTAASVFINTSGFPVPGMGSSTVTEVVGQYAVGTLQSANPLSVLGGSTTLTIHGTGSTIGGRLTGQNYATISGPGDLTLNGGLYGNGLQINLEGGVTVNGSSEFYAGLQIGRATFTGLTTFYGSLVALVNPATPLLAYPIVNTGVMRMNDVTSISNANLTNQPGAVIEKLTGSGSATICTFNGLIPRFTNYGTIQCASGTLNVNGYGEQRGHWITSGTGRIGIQGEQTLRGGFFAGNAIATLTNGSTLTTASNNGNMILGGLEISDGFVIANSPIIIKNLTMTGGRFRGPEMITIDGPASVTGGVFESGTTRFFGPQTQWTGGTSRIISNRIEVLGTLTRSGGGEIATDGVLENYGTFRTTGGGQMMGLEVINNGDWVVDNAALGGMFISRNGADGSFANNGAVQVLGGIFELGVSGTSNGSWTNSPSTLTRFGQVTHNFGSASTFSGARFSSFGALLDFEGPSTLPYLALSGSNGTEIRSQTSVTIEDVEAPTGGAVTMSGEGEIVFGDQFSTGEMLYFNGPGATVFAGGVNATGFGTWLVNRSVTLQGSSNLGVGIQGSQYGDVVNSGHLNWHGANTTVSTLTFVNTGTMTTSGLRFATGDTASFVQGGTMNVTGSGITLTGRSSHNGLTTTSGNARLRLDGGIHDFSLGNNNSDADVILQRTALDSPEIVIDQPTTVRSLELLNAARITANNPLDIGVFSGVAPTIGGTSIVRAASMPGLSFFTVDPGATLSVEGGPSGIQQPNIGGILDLKGAGQRDLFGSVIGDGTVFNRADSHLRALQIVTVQPNLKNQGTLTVDSSGIGTSLLWTKLHNTGTANIRNVNLGCFQTPNQTGGTFGGGTWKIGPEGRVSVSNPITHWESIAQFIGPGSNIAVQGGSSALTNLVENNGRLSFLQGNSQTIFTNLTSRGLIETDATSSFNMNGSLTMPMGELKNEGSMTISGGVTVNSGTVNLGGTLTTPQFNQLGGGISPGHAGVGQGTINGNWSVGFLSSLSLDIAGTGAGQFDRFSVNGLATLGGFLDVRIPNGTTLPAGASMPILASSQPVNGGVSQVPPGFILSIDGNTANLSTLATLGHLTTISGSIALQDFQSDPFGLPLTISFSQDGTPMGFVNTIIDESGNYFVNTHLRGTFDIYADTGSWLRRKIVGGITITDEGVANVNFVLPNGDVDSSGEVDAADIDEVIEAFGVVGTSPEDVDGSLEVDAADIDIVIANFGLTDD